ncbi:hypothetical protein K438DRAFT_2019377 [Mycena galopus ATCC 62051]|nr:hypothetical protein K438DRAFT_2019377 [Mycena galopus ATCC 62051]
MARRNTITTFAKGAICVVTRACAAFSHPATRAEPHLPSLRTHRFSDHILPARGVEPAETELGEKESDIDDSGIYFPASDLFLDANDADEADTERFAPPPIPHPRLLFLRVHPRRINIRLPRLSSLFPLPNPFRWSG